MSKLRSHDPFGYLKHELWPKKGSGITLIPLRAGGVTYTLGKLSMKDTTLL
jgi:hypothetical protein